MTEGFPDRFGALQDIRVIDLTQMLAGPFATMLLADHGATVIKVEPPTGDMSRAAGPYRDDDEQRTLGGYFQSLNRNKRSVCVDLKTSEGRDAVKALIRDADVLIENFRAGVMERFGLGFDVLREINPRLVYACIRGFGDPHTGASPYSAWPAFDVVAQAMGGLMAITGPNATTPTKIGPGLGDIIPGIMCAFGILAAVHSARSSGKGQFLDVAMVDAILAVCERTVWQHSIQHITPGPEGNHHPFLCPFGIYPASDGFVTLGAFQDAYFRLLCEKLDAPEILMDERFQDDASRKANRTDLIDALSERTARFTKAELTQRLGGQMPYGPVMHIADIFQDPHFSAREMIVSVEQPGSGTTQIAGVPIKLSETPGGIHRRSPLLGEHTDEILSAAGLSSAEIDRASGRT